ncbi:MAG: ribonuclease Y, partial [Solobacterium sp.]|nr:ribonuclease Y [Solobacterium sp.]
MNNILVPILACLVGLVIGVIIMMIASRNGLDAARVQAEALLDESKVKAENVIRQATLDGK